MNDLQHPALRPEHIGELRLANRLAVSPMTRVSAAGGRHADS